ncbi:MAG: LamG domain-containing protein [Planctomycetota bacterium]|jgi:hypothetical protein
MKKLLALLLLVALPAFGQVGSRDFESSDSDYANSAGAATTFASDTAGSILVWVKIESCWNTAPSYGAFASIGDTATNNYSFIVNIGTAEVTGSPCAGATDVFYTAELRENGSGNRWVLTSTRDALDADIGAWVHVAVTQDGTAPKFYFNGAEDGSAGLSTNGTGDGTEWFNDLTGLDDFALGKLTRSSPCCYHDGLIADVHVYDRALSEGEINMVMRCPGSIADGLVGYWPSKDDFADHSNNSNNASNSGTATSTDGPPIGGCYGGQSIGVQ